MENSRFKFRAWDLENKKLLKCTAVYDDMSCRVKDDATDRHTASKKCKLMQYTGLKDKNGVEIYEGDILRDDENTIFSVIWDDRQTEAGFKMLLEYTTKNHLKTTKYLRFTSWLNPDNYIEVIGNICENPELLENKE